MQPSTKQRIVGTIVLLTLALIFLPIVFDGQGSYQVPLSSRIPEPPQVAVLPEPQQTRPVIIADSITPPTAIAPADPTELSEPAEPSGSTETGEVMPSTTDLTGNPPSLGADGLPQAWSLRLGSFADAVNANVLLVRLQQAGYRAYTRSITSETGELTSVFVGPWLSRAQVDNYRQELQADAGFALTGIVVPYRIED